MLRVVIIKDNSNYFNELKIPTVIIAGDFFSSIFESPTPFKSDHEKFKRSNNKWGVLIKRKLLKDEDV